MFGSESARDVTPMSHADAFADRFQSARRTQDGSTIFLETRRPVADFINGLCKILFAVAVLGLVAIGGVITFNALDLKAEAGPVVSGSAVEDRQARELDELRSEVALLTEQSMAMRAELVLLTGRDGVLPKLVSRLQEQRKVNGAHSNAIRQLYSTTGLIGASLPLADEGTASESVGSRPVQVTPVAASQEEDTPKRVVLIPEGDAEADKDGE
ncbi:hypothetical protein [uncultured Tateyamaria sp.]|uniref:hypothetical protein n=1 Tax=uncultured Tateyamaria sp. TaxID=455651 RepID=UPI002611839A|nr:hypothetical protein [uncultured Tateyamaria sp.]